MESIWHDITWVLPLRSESATVVMRGFTWMGYSTFYMLFLPLGYWLWRKEAFTRLAIMVAVAGVMNAFLKDFWQDPRPDPSLSLDGLVAGSFGMPSGHAQVSTVLWLWLAWEVRRWWMWALGLFFISGIIASRLYLGTHDIEDVVVGASLGVACVVAGQALVRLVRLPLMIVGIGLLVAQTVVFLMWPHDGPGAQTGFGAFGAAWALGAAWERQKIGYRPADGWRRIAAGGLGVAILMALFVGLSKGADMIDPDGDSAMYVATMLITFYMTVGAPALFRKLRLAG